MRTREQIEADLALRFSVPDFVGWQRAIGRIADDVPALLAALAAAEARAEQASQRAAEYEQDAREWQSALLVERKRADAAVQALERVKATCDELIRGADEAEARIPGQVSWVANATRECVASVLAALSSPSTEPSKGSDDE